MHALQILLLTALLEANNIDVTALYAHSQQEIFDDHKEEEDEEEDQAEEEEEDGQALAGTLGPTTAAAAAVVCAHTDHSNMHEEQEDEGAQSSVVVLADEDKAKSSGTCSYPQGLSGDARASVAMNTLSSAAKSMMSRGTVGDCYLTGHPVAS